jgi:tetratricopeptide (TPR) repeat protein
MRRKKNVWTWLAIPMLPVALAGCAQPGTVDEVETADPTASAVVYQMPLTTESEEAREQFMAGLDAADRGRFVEAKERFAAASAADEGLAVAHLGQAITATSAQDFARHLEAATAAGATASEAERLWIEVYERNFANDQEGRLAAAERLVAAAPDSPRARLELAQALVAVDRIADARQAAEESVTTVPGFVAGHAYLVNNYMFSEPRDFAKAEEHARALVEVAPDQDQSHDLLGDVHRAQGRLEEARESYTRASQIDNENGIALQQRGHVNSFLGDWQQARADYDAAIEAADANAGAGYRVWRSLVSAYEGKPADAVAELDAVAAAVDGMGVDNPHGVKIFALTEEALIAMHHGMYDQAAGALDRAEALAKEQADQVGRDEFRRNQEVFLASLRGRLAVQQGDLDGALAQAARIDELVAGMADPLAGQPAHALRGHVALARGDAAEAVAELEQSSLGNPYNRFQLAKAKEAAGDAEAAARLYREVADYNFNNADFAIVRKDALAKVDQ